LRYLGEVATACSAIDEKLDRDELYEQLLHVAKRKTVEADTKLDERGKKIKEDEDELGENVLIVEQPEPDQQAK